VPRGIPRRPRLTKRDERLATQVLSPLPLSAPRIEIDAYQGDPFEIDLCERNHYFIPLREGSSGFCAEYDSRTGEILEADYSEVSRRVKALGMWSYQVRTIGGSFDHGRFGVIWNEVCYCRVGHNQTYEMCEMEEFYPHWRKPGIPRRLAAPGEMSWEEPQVARGPDKPCLVQSGFNVVAVAGQRFECMRTITLTSVESDQRDSEQRIDLDDRYISRDGRTVLRRRYRSVAQEPGWLEGRPHINYNGADFYGWFDTITDVALAGLVDGS